VSDWKLLDVLRGHDDVVFSAAFRPDGKKLASASFDRTVRVWDVATYALGQTHAGHSDFVYAVAWSPDGKRLASASKDRTVKYIDAATGKSVFTFGGMDEDVVAVAISPDGKHAVSSGLQPGIAWWNPETGEKVRTQAGHGVGVNELAFSKDGQILVSAGSDRTARVWNGTSGAPVKTLAVGSVVYSVAVSPDRKRVATGSFDGLVRLWDEPSGRHLLSLLAAPGAKDGAEWLALAPEGYAVASERLAAQGRWRMGGQEVASASVWGALRQPDMLARAARGEAVAAPAFKK
jgi:WD40 repeat protein